MLNRWCNGQEPSGDIAGGDGIAAYGVVTCAAAGNEGNAAATGETQGGELPGFVSLRYSAVVSLAGATPSCSVRSAASSS
jgi:hypothetical protein